MVTARGEDVAIITGAAGGMGAAIARALGDQGRSLKLCDLLAAPLEELAAKLRAKVRVAILAGDISSPLYPAQVMSALEGGRIGLLVHAAGVSPTMADGKRVLEINFAATRRVVEAAISEHGSGRRGHSHCLELCSDAGALADRPGRKKPAERQIIIGGLADAAQFSHGLSLSKRPVQLYAQVKAPDFGKVGARTVSLARFEAGSS